MMLSEVERKPILVARPIFEQFLKVFPTSVRHIIHFYFLKFILYLFA